MTTRAICSQCNSGWLKTRFEDRARPLLSSLISGQLLPEPVEQLRDAQRPYSDSPTVQIDGDDRALLALWAYKTALILELANDPRRDNPLEVKEAEYRRFRSEETLPPGFSIALGCYGAGPMIVHAQRVAHVYRPPSDGDQATEGQFCWTFLMRPLVFQILSAGSPGQAAKGHADLYPAETKSRLILLSPDPEFQMPLTIPGVQLPGIPRSPLSGFADPSVWPPPQFFAPAEYGDFAAGPRSNNVSRFEGRWAGLEYGEVHPPSDI